MEINSRYCEVSTYAASSSGYNSSTASSSLNYIDDVCDNQIVIDKNIDNPNKNNNCEEINRCNIIDEKSESSIDLSDNQQPVTKLIITITLMKSEQV